MINQRGKSSTRIIIAILLLLTVTPFTLTQDLVAQKDQSFDIKLVRLLDDATGNASGWNPNGSLMRFTIKDNSIRTNSVVSITIDQPSPNSVVGTIGVGDNPNGVACCIASLSGLLIGGARLLYVTNSDDDTVSVISTGTRTVTATINVGDRPRNIDIKPHMLLGSARIYLVAYDGSLQVINAGTNTVILTSTGGTIQDMVVDPTTNRIYTAETGANNISAVVARDASNNSFISVITGLPAGAESLALNPDTNLLYLSTTEFKGGQQAISVIDTQTDSVIATIPVASVVYDMAVNPRTNRIYAIHKDPSVTVLDGSTNRVINTINLGQGITSQVALDPETNTLYVTAEPNQLFVISGHTNSVIATVRVGNLPYGVDVDPTASRIYVANSGDDTVSVITGSQPSQFTCGVSDLATDGFSISCTNPPPPDSILNYAIMTNPTTLEITPSPSTSKIRSSEGGTTTYQIDVEQKAFDVKVTSEGIVSMAFNKEEKTMALENDGTSGIVEIEIPKELLGGEFTVMADANTIEFKKSETDTHTTLLLEKPADSNVITIQGTTVVPEFPVVILAFASFMGFMLVVLRKFQIRLRK